MILATVHDAAYTKLCFLLFFFFCVVVSDAITVLYLILLLSISFSGISFRGIESSKTAEMPEISFHHVLLTPTVRSKPVESLDS
jgi:hypothetical protein